MRLDLLIITGQSYIKEVFVFPQLTESDAYIALKVVPSQAELFVPHLNTKAGCWITRWGLSPLSTST